MSKRTNGPVDGSPLSGLAWYVVGVWILPDLQCATIDLITDLSIMRHGSVPSHSVSHLCVAFRWFTVDSARQNFQLLLQCALNTRVTT